MRGWCCGEGDPLWSELIALAPYLAVVLAVVLALALDLALVFSDEIKYVDADMQP